MSDISISFFEILYWHWFVLAALLGVVEILAPGVFFLWLAIGAFITGILAAIIPGLGEATQIMIFGILSIALIFAAWKYIKKAPLTSDQPLLNQRSAQQVGKTFTLETAIEDGVGRIKMGDTTWKVEGPDMPAGSHVRVIGYDGPVFKVEKA